jgi:nitrogen-specific signal transduction histidine kinase
MLLRAWFRPPRHLLALFLLITLVPSILLIALGWRSLRQDRAQRLQDSRERAADLAVSSLQQSLSATERQLQDLSITAADDSVTVQFEPDSVKGKLLFYPFTVTGKEAPASVFAPGEDLEFHAGDYNKAAGFFSELARSNDAAIRAGALIRLARNLRKSGMSPAALGVYRQAAEVRGVAVAGVPADLFARWAACELLEGDELHREAEALRRDLIDGRWQLDRATFDLHFQDSGRWLGDASAPPAGPLALAEGAEYLWRSWQSAQRPSGREIVQFERRDLTILWTGDGKRLTALIAGPDFVERTWTAKLAPMLARERARVSLRDSGAKPGSGAESRRAASETGLPWTVGVVAGPSPGLGGLWIGGLAFLAVLVISGTYFIARAVSRELAVARLQSDFVSAVSHEFRTPLTSMRQLTEILSDGRVTSEDRRRIYYEALVRQTERLHQLVESLLDFGRMEAGASPYRLEPLDACALVRNVVEQFEREAEGRGYHVALDVNGATATVAGDREALTNALWNLLDNAVKYSPECRTVWVDTERNNTRLMIRVRDHGMGIPQEEQKEIFRKFVRGASAKAHNIKGTGIGLAMVDHIVQAHGGEILVQSQPGAGSTFTLLLPCHES